MRVKASFGRIADLELAVYQARTDRAEYVALVHLLDGLRRSLDSVKERQAELERRFLREHGTDWSRILDLVVI